ncbi:MAG TPA: 3-phosphoshikimate 1-carboxyvinyltransferase [Anaerolineales bacterium]
MNLIIIPGHPLSGEIGDGALYPLPGDKSLSHRAALLAALAEGVSVIENFLVSGVTRAMLNALTDLGVSWELNGNALQVQGKGLRGLRSPERPINCGNSATTIRLLAGALAASGVHAVLDGSAGLRARPMGRIVEPLQAMGVPITASAGDCAPLTLANRPVDNLLRALDYTLPVASAQVKSCLLLAALAANGTMILREPGPSRDHTERMLRSMGIQISGKRPNEPGNLSAPSGSLYETRISPTQPVRLAPLQLCLPGDLSAAAFLIVAAVITPGSRLEIKGVGLNPARTGLLEALRSMGADIRESSIGERGGEPVGDLMVVSSPLHGTQIRGDLVVRMIDEFPAFAVAAAYADGLTQVSEAGELRHKESDRITALCAELHQIGVRVSETPDGFSVEGGWPLRGGAIQPHGDHRLAMSLAVAGLAAREPVIVQNAEIMNESFPDFAATLQSLGASLKVEA